MFRYFFIVWYNEYTFFLVRGKNLDNVLVSLAMLCYMAAIIGIGLYYAKKAHRSTDHYFLGGRSLGPYVTAMSAEAYDMSGWLLMGLPGVAYFTGITDAFWTAL